VIKTIQKGRLPQTSKASKVGAPESKAGDVTRLRKQVSDL